MIVRRISLSLAALAVTAGACGRVTGGGDAGIDHPTGADQLVLRVDTAGGFVPVDYHLRQFPEFSLLGDGSIVTVGPQIAIYPGPALPNLLVTAVTEEGVQAILEAAREAGLFGPDRHYDHPGIADAPTTTFTLNVEGDQHVISAYALGLDPGGSGVSEEDRRARAKLAELQGKLTDLRSWLPESSVGEERPFELSELRVFVTSFDSTPEDPALEQPLIEWPLQPPLGVFGDPADDLEGFRCGSVSGEDLATLLPLARSANELTPWASGGTEYHLLFRPLLPDEHGCGGGGGEVTATLRDFAISLDPEGAATGEVSFAISNDGPSAHELVLFRTNLAPDGLPEGDGGVDEQGEGIELVGDVRDIAAASASSLTVNLDEGAYVVICNIPGHYAAGMRAAFTVK